MTCGEIHSFFEGPEPGRRDLAADVANHLRTCLSCGHEFQAQIELLGVLNLVRDSAPGPSPALDSVVLENFRKRVGQAAPSAILLRKPLRAAAFFWRGAVAAAVVLAAVLLFAYRRVISMPPIQAVQVVPVASPQAAPALNSVAKVAPQAVPATARPHRNAHRVATSAPGAVTANEHNPFPEDFNRLMYCDSLSCSGTMEVIRMQLPAPPAESPGAENPIFADVVVGPDGIARGFRIVR